jgi:hypothetical protein
MGGGGGIGKISSVCDVPSSFFGHVESPHPHRARWTLPTWCEGGEYHRARRYLATESPLQPSVYTG